VALMVTDDDGRLAERFRLRIVDTNLAGNNL
jgi:hypothetical protein